MLFNNPTPPGADQLIRGRPRDLVGLCLQANTQTQETQRDWDGHTPDLLILTRQRSPLKPSPVEECERKHPGSDPLPASSLQNFRLSMRQRTHPYTITPPITRDGPLMSPSPARAGHVGKKRPKARRSEKRCRGRASSTSRHARIKSSART